MLTLHKHPENQEVCKMVRGRTKIAVYWHPKINDELQNTVEDLANFNNSYLRDRYELSKDQASNIFDNLKLDEVSEKFQQKYFKVKQHVHNALLTEMDISDTGDVFIVDFEKDIHKYSGHELICSGTGSGKTYYVVQKILNNLKGQKNQRRQFLIFSAE